MSVKLIQLVMLVLVFIAVTAARPPERAYACNNELCSYDTCAHPLNCSEESCDVSSIPGCEGCEWAGNCTEEQCGDPWHIRLECPVADVR